MLARNEGICKICGESCIRVGKTWVHRDADLDEHHPQGLHRAQPEIYEEDFQEICEESDEDRF